MGAVLTAAHCFVNTAAQRYTLIYVKVLVGAYVNPPEYGWFHLVHLTPGLIDLDFPQGYLQAVIDYIKWDIAVLTLPPDEVVPVEVVPVDAYLDLSKSSSAQAT